MKTHEMMVKTCNDFLAKKAGATLLNGDPEDCFAEGWFPKVGDRYVNCGDKFPTPKGGFGTKEQATKCAEFYQSLCQKWLEDNTVQ